MRLLPFRIALTLGLLAVVLGAFGAHALKPQLSQNGSIETWKTAVDYQMWHAIVLLVISLHSQHLPHAKAAGRCFILGILFFSGSLYWLALGGPRWLGPVTPIGGLLLLTAWAMLLKSTFTQHEATH